MARRRRYSYYDEAQDRPAYPPIRDRGQGASFFPGRPRKCVFQIRRSFVDDTLFST
jgi:hypothetical protein